MNRPSHWLASLLVGYIAPLSAGEPQQAWSSRHPSWPALVVNQEPELCASILRISEEWFTSPRPSAWEPVLMRTEFDEVDFGDELPAKTGFGYSQELDLDDDGVPERVVFKGA